MRLKLILTHGLLFFAGAAAASSLKRQAPRVGQALRPVVKQALKEGMVLRRTLQVLAGEVREDLEDPGAESVLELSTGAADRKVAGLIGRVSSRGEEQGARGCG